MCELIPVIYSNQFYGGDPGPPSSPPALREIKILLYDKKVSATTALREIKVFYMICKKVSTTTALREIKALLYDM
jgi:hypothetical protein